MFPPQSNNLKQIHNMTMRSPVVPSKQQIKPSPKMMKNHCPNYSYRRYRRGCFLQTASARAAAVVPTVLFLCCQSSSLILSVSSFTVQPPPSTSSSSSSLHHHHHHHRNQYHRGMYYSQYHTNLLSSSSSPSSSSFSHSIILGRHASSSSFSSLKRYLSSSSYNNNNNNNDDIDTIIPPVPRLYYHNQNDIIIEEEEEDETDSSGSSTLLSATKIPPLSKNAIITLTEGQSNYVKVMRLNSHKRWGKWTGYIRLFDEHGEWLAKILQDEQQQQQQQQQRKSNMAVVVECIELIRLPSSSLPLSITTTTNLYMGMIKKQRRKWVLEKATELGIDTISAVDTEYSEGGGGKKKGKGKKNSEAWDYTKHKLQVIEASEQCERFTIPKLSHLSWDDLINQIERTIQQQSSSSNDIDDTDNDDNTDNVLWLICRERQPSNQSLLNATQRQQQASEKRTTKEGIIINIVVGPEGGWSPNEIKQFEELESKYDQHQNQNIVFVSLGSLILRAETAAISAVATVMMSLDNK